MRFKTTEKVTNEIVLSGLSLILRKNSFFDISEDKVGHHELVWAIHKGYISAVDDEAKKASSANKKCYINNSKKTIVCSHLRYPLGPSEKVILLADDPVCKELDKLVHAGRLCEFSLKDSVVPNEDKVGTNVESNISHEAKKEVSKIRKSFKKNSSKTKEELKEVKKENTSKTIKLNSESTIVVAKPENGQIFLGNNNEEFNFDKD